MRSLLILLASAAAAATASDADVRQALSVDVAIWGGTVCAITGAIATARMNHTAAIVLEYGTHLGGMTTGGLSGMDLNMPVGGIWREFMARANMTKATFPNFEAHVAAAAFADMLAEVADRVTIVQQTGGIASVQTSGKRIVSLTTASGAVVSAPYFLDCSYEGDLLRLSGTAWTVGREPASQYNESVGGAEGAPWSAGRYPPSVSPWTDDSNTTLLPTVSLAPDEIPGQGDGRVQSYNYRLCVTNNASIRVPLAPPAGYTPASMELARRWWAAQDPNGPVANFTLRDIFQIRPLPNSKFDVNNGANVQFSTDMPFLQFEYPTANWSTRLAVEAAHEWWTRALWTFYATDPVIPRQLQAELNTYGLCGDEFNATGHWPPQMYIREGIRMVGSVVLTQADVYGAATKTSPSSVGLSKWLIDIHAVQRVAAQDDDGKWWVVEAGHCTSVDRTWQLTEVPYGALVPAPGDTANLLVPVCVSSTHIAYATYRLEAQFGVFGQSAAVAAVLALEAGGLAVQDVDVPALQTALLAQGQILNATKVNPGNGSAALAACAPGSALQRWGYHPGDGTIRLASDSSTCASIFGYSKAPGARVFAAACHTDDKRPEHANQEFAVVPAPGGPAGTVQVQSRLSGLCVGGASYEPGAELVQVPCSDDYTAWASLSADPVAGVWQLYADGLPQTLCVAAPSSST